MALFSPSSSPLLGRSSFSSWQPLTCTSSSFVFLHASCDEDGMHCTCCGRWVELWSSERFLPSPASAKPECREHHLPSHRDSLRHLPAPGLPCLHEQMQPSGLVFSTFLAPFPPLCGRRCRWLLWPLPRPGMHTARLSGRTMAAALGSQFELS